MDVALDTVAAIEPEGDCALTVRFGQVPGHETIDLVRRATEAVEAASLPSRVELVSSYAALTVLYSPLEATYGQMEQAVRAALCEAAGRPSAPVRLFEVPVCYGGVFGPDLEDVARLAGMGPDDVVQAHCKALYRIDMLGFLPGFAYLSGLDPRLTTPRLSVPRTRIPAGSVGIGGSQTGVYPLDSPGGWRLVGRTPALLYDPRRSDPVPFHPGDLMRFVPVDEASFARLDARVARGEDVLRVLDGGACAAGRREGERL